jgi:hypothetical protein
MQQGKDHSAPIHVDRNNQKTIASLIDAGFIRDQETLYLTYKGRSFTGTLRRNGIELPDGAVYSPSAAAIRCYEETGASRPTENGWRVWKNTDGKTLDELFAQLQPVTLEDLGL